MIMERPLAAAFAVSDIFSFYSYGLVKPGDINCLPAGEDINHAMVLAGLDLVGQGNYIQQSKEVLMARWKDPLDYEWGCQNTGEYWYTDFPDFCLWDEIIDDNIYMDDGPFWKIQNSWGEDFGHHGFAYIQHVMPGEHPEFTEGTCQMF